MALTLGVVATVGKATRDKSMWGFLNGVSVCDKGMWDKIKKLTKDKQQVSKDICLIFNI